MATFGEKERPGAGVVTAHLDFEEVGRQAVRAFRMLRGNPSLSSVSAMLACNISNGAAEVLLEDTRPSIEELNLPQVDFYGDIEAGGILRMERFFDECDDIDRCIIIRLVQHMTYSDIAEELFISEGTVSYRVKKLQALTRTASREDLVEFLKRYREE